MYKVTKGWPAEGAIDEILTVDTGATVEGGQIAVLESTGNVVLGDYAGDGSDSDKIAFFVIDSDQVKAGQVVGLKSPCVIEVDADHFAADTYTPLQELTAIGGKFAAIGTSEPAIAKVLSYDGTNGKMRVLWTAVA